MGVLGSAFDDLDGRAFGPFDTPPKLFTVDPGVDNYLVPNSKLWDLGTYEVVTQAGHTFIVGDAVKKSSVGSVYVLAQATDLDAGSSTGVVSAIGTGGNVDKFALQVTGLADIGNVAGGRYTSNLTVGQTYYLSGTTAGLGTTVLPSQSEIYRPLFVAISTTRVAIISAQATINPTLGYTTFNQASPSFLVGDAVRKSGSGWVTAQGDTLANAGTSGIISSKSGDDYVVTHSGYADIGNVSGGRYASAFSDNLTRYLSADTAGAGTTSYPSSGRVVCPLFVPISATRVAVLGFGTHDPGPQDYQDFTQASPSFLIGQAVQRTSSGWVVADSATLAEAETTGLISAKNGDNYRVATGGIVKIGNVSGGQYTGDLTAAEVRYLSSAGGTTSTAPSAGAVEKPVFVALDTNYALIYTDRPRTAGGAVVSFTASMPATAQLYRQAHGRATVPNYLRVVLVRKNSAFVYNPNSYGGSDGPAAAYTINVGQELDAASIQSGSRGAENERFYTVVRPVLDDTNVDILLNYPYGLSWLVNAFGENGLSSQPVYGSIGLSTDYDLKIYVGWL